MPFKLKFLILFACLLAAMQGASQKRYNTWFFGNKAGLDFNTSPPTPLQNPLIEGETPPYYTSSICDTAGKLLFYTNGFTVWNYLNEELPKFQARWPWFQTDNVLPLVFPYPKNDSLYYLFGVAKGNSPNAGKLISLTINMAARFGTGAIVYPDPQATANYYTVHTDNASYLLAGTVHCNQQDTWIATIANGAIQTYLVSPDGIGPAISKSLPASYTSPAYSYFNIKFSANGEKFVIPYYGQNKLLVYDFNNQTGAFSNEKLISLPANEILKDMELSPDGTKLYYGSYIKEVEGPDFTGVELHNIYQLDLEVGTAAGIENSRYLMNPFPDRGGCPRSCFTIERSLLLGPDGKIYISLRDVSTSNLDLKMNVIEFPDLLREKASYRRNNLLIGTKYKFINVNYIKSASFSLKENGIQVRKKLCAGLPAAFSLLFTRIDSVKWDFGDPATGAANYSTVVDPLHTYSATGQYTASAIIYKDCWIDTAKVMISIDPDPIVRIPGFIHDTTICTGSTLLIDAKTPAATSYEWSDGLIYSNRSIDKPGIFLVKAFNACSDDERSFEVRFKDCPCEIYVPSAFTPDNNGRNDVFRPGSLCLPKDYRLLIYNRSGSILFATENIAEGWDGMYKKLQQPTGVYVWMMQYKDPNNGQAVMRKGTLTLIR